MVSTFERDNHSALQATKRSAETEVLEVALLGREARTFADWVE